MRAAGDRAGAALRLMTREIGMEEGCAVPIEVGGGQDATDRLDELIPLAVVIAAGCEPCAQNMVRRALVQGVPLPLVKRAVGIVAHMQRLECFEEALGAEAVARMLKPILAARRELRERAAATGQGQGCCG